MARALYPLCPHLNHAQTLGTSGFSAFSPLFTALLLVRRSFFLLKRPLTNASERVFELNYVMQNAQADKKKAGTGGRAGALPGDWGGLPGVRARRVPSQ